MKRQIKSIALQYQLVAWRYFWAAAVYQRSLHFFDEFQRKKRGVIDPERNMRDKWNKMFKRLQAYQHEHDGSCDVPQQQAHH